VRKGENVRKNFDRKAFDREGTWRWTEALHDVRILPVDLDLDEISDELGKLRAAPLLRRMRG
jgi:hypothetical protein